MEEDHYYTSICSAATLQSDKKGFFLNYAESVMDLAGAGWLEEFGKLKSDQARLLKCYNDTQLYEAVHGVLQNVQPLFRGKAARISQLRRIEGDRAAAQGKHQRALLLLTQAVVRAPVAGVDKTVDEGQSLTLALWSRAQVLWNLSEYSLCLFDLQLCLKEKLPDKFRVEAYWRQAGCYREMGEPARAKVALQVAMKSLGPDDCEWRDKVEAELSALPSKAAKPLENKTDEEVLLEKPHPQLSGLSSALAVRSDTPAGRYIVARQPLSSGDVLAIEQPYVACLLPDKFGSHCHHCFARLQSAVGCDHCANVAFCNALCRDNAQIYHTHECRYMDLLVGSGASILCHLALRTITQQTYDYWCKVYHHQPVSPDFKKLAGLVTHAERRQTRDFVSRTLMALLLLRILERSGYIPASNCSDDELKGMPLFIGSVLLHLLQSLQFNAHQIYETIYKEELNFNSKINYIGVGVYSSVSLFNHSCYPALARYFRGKQLVLRAVRPLKSGEQVAENYGPTYVKQTLAERQRSLISRYWFTCDCIACAQDWPKLDNLDENLVNIRCREKDCGGFITTTMEPKSSKDKCPVCKSRLNVSEALLLIKSYQDDYERGLALMAEGQLQEAAGVFTSFSDVMHTICLPPIKNVTRAHEAVRSCWAYPHNKHVLNSYQTASFTHFHHGI